MKIIQSIIVLPMMHVAINKNPNNVSCAVGSEATRKDRVVWIASGKDSTIFNGALVVRITGLNARNAMVFATRTSAKTINN